METSILYKKIEDENINYVNAQLFSTRGAIASCNNLTAIVVDDIQVKTVKGENTVLMQELGHYMSGAFYKTNSPYDLIEKQEHKADKKAWETFFPYEKIKELMRKGLTTVTQLAEYFDVESPYMARCVNYYYNQYNGFN